jgi:hypothetical protein
MHQRLRCPECHHWTDALLVWAAGDCCPRCNAPIALDAPSARERGDAGPGSDLPWGAADRPWQAPGGIRPGARHRTLDSQR